MHRYTKDKILKTLTILSSSISIIVLAFIVGYIISKGSGSLSFDMMKQDYWSKNELANINHLSNFNNPNNFEPDVYFIKSYGIAIKDSLSIEKDKVIEIVYMAENSPFNEATSLISGVSFGSIQPVPNGALIESVVIDGSIMGGTIYGDEAGSLARKMNESTKGIELYYQTQGGGIRGSLFATLILIVMSILIAFPIASFAALYLVEIAKKTPVTKILEYLIELLAGVPSVVFGLMGMSVLYPIVAAFNITGQSIILGAMTMAVILMPIIIRSVQESLLSVPDDLRTASLSLGATQTQTIFKVLIPSALPGLLSALILSVSRVIGESAALIFTMGTFVNDAPRLSESASTLSVHIWSLMSHEQPNFELASAIALIILAMVLVLNITLHIIGNHYRKKLGV